MNRKRSRGRALALQVLYAVDVCETASPESALAMFGACVEHFAGDIDSEGRAFAESLLLRATNRLDEINEELSGASNNWRLSRMSRVDRNILRLAACELGGEKEIPVPVVLNEAVELAKTFGAEGSPAFVNGILDKVASLQSAETPG